MNLELNDIAESDIGFEVVENEVGIEDIGDIPDGFHVLIDEDIDADSAEAKALTVELPRKSKKTGKPLDFFTLNGNAPGKPSSCSIELVKKDTDGPVFITTHEKSGKLRTRRLQLNLKGPTIAKATSFPTSKSQKAIITVSLDRKGGTTKAKVKVF